MDLGRRGNGRHGDLELVRVRNLKLQAVLARKPLLLP